MSDSSISLVVGAFSLTTFIVTFAICIVVLAGVWGVYKKAGYNGWECLIPFYNNFVLCQIVYGNGILFLLLFVPCVNIIFMFKLYFDLATCFGKGTGFKLGLLFLPVIFFPMLGFSSESYYLGTIGDIKNGNGQSYGGGWDY